MPRKSKKTAITTDDGRIPNHPLIGRRFTERGGILDGKVLKVVAVYAATDTRPERCTLTAVDGSGGMECMTITVIDSLTAEALSVESAA